jgi:hypothetical protein
MAQHKSHSFILQNQILSNRKEQVEEHLVQFTQVLSQLKEVAA